MVRDHSQSFLGLSRQRASLFTLVAGAMFVAGFLLSEFAVDRNTSRAVPIGFGLLFLLQALTASQAYFNGSAVLSLLISLAPPLGFLAMTALFHWRPHVLFLLHLGITISLLFGVAGHLIGAQMTRIRETPSNPSHRGQLALAALMFGFVIWHLVSV